MVTKTKNRVTKVEDNLWDMHGQLSDMISTLYKMENKLPKTKYEDTLERMRELILHLDNAYFTIEHQLSKELLEDAYYSKELDLSLSHHRDVNQGNLYEESKAK